MEHTEARKQTQAEADKCIATELRAAIQKLSYARQAADRAGLRYRIFGTIDGESALIPGKVCVSEIERVNKL